MVVSKALVAKIDRPSGVVNFQTAKDSNDILNSWSMNLEKLLELVEKSCHQIHKEMMVHKAALRAWNGWERLILICCWCTFRPYRSGHYTCRELVFSHGAVVWTLAHGPSSLQWTIVFSIVWFWCSSVGSIPFFRLDWHLILSEIRCRNTCISYMLNSSHFLNS